MKNTMTIYEVGVRTPNGGYSTFIESPDLSVIESYLQIMKKTTATGFQCVLSKRDYELICTTPMEVHEVGCCGAD